MRIDLFILGYKKITVNKSDMARASSSLLKRGLSAKISNDSSFFVPIHKCKKYIAALKGIEYSISEPQGLVSYFINNKHRYGLFLGAVIVILYFIFISSFVFDVRITGNENIPSAVIEEELSKVGFCAGSSWRSLSLSEVERRLLETSDTVGWININRYGNVAYVTVREKTVYGNKEEQIGFSNVVASVDAVIEEITVKSGIALVKAGDTVKAGDLLISGIIPSELGGGFVRAEGEIYGRVSEEISVEVPKTETVNIYGEEKLSKVTLKIFKFSINIFKSYRKNEGSYAIIEDVEECVVFGKYRLPIEICKIYHQPIVKSEKTYNEKEIISVASSRLAKLRLLKLADAELLKMRTYGEFTDSGYRMTAGVVELRDIGEERYFSK